MIDKYSETVDRPRTVDNEFLTKFIKQKPAKGWDGKRKKGRKRRKNVTDAFPFFFSFFFFLASLDVNLPDVLNAKLYELSAII